MPDSHDDSPTRPADLRVRMEIKGLILEPRSRSPVVVLKDEESSRLLPIWIGTAEAQAIANRLQGVQFPRPMTHDLLLATIEALEASVDEVVISRLEKNTFYAVIHLRRGSDRLEIDSRPSDALALALRADAPVFVLQSVLDRAATLDGDQEGAADTDLSKEEEALRRLRELSPDDLGKYKM